MIRISDSRFQGRLAEKARRGGKLPKDWQVPDRWKVNTPEGIAGWIGNAEGTLPTFPFGTDFSEVVRDLLPALDHIRANRGDPA